MTILSSLIDIIAFLHHSAAFPQDVLELAPEQLHEAAIVDAVCSATLCAGSATPGVQSRPPARLCGVRLENALSTPETALSTDSSSLQHPGPSRKRAKHIEQS